MSAPEDPEEDLIDLESFDESTTMKPNDGVEKETTLQGQHIEKERNLTQEQASNEVGGEMLSSLCNHLSTKKNGETNFNLEDVNCTSPSEPDNKATRTERQSQLKPLRGKFAHPNNKQFTFKDQSKQSSAIQNIDESINTAEVRVASSKPSCSANAAKEDVSARNSAESADITFEECGQRKHRRTLSRKHKRQNPATETPQSSSPSDHTMPERTSSRAEPPGHEIWDASREFQQDFEAVKAKLLHERSELDKNERMKEDAEIVAMKLGRKKRNTLAGTGRKEARQFNKDMASTTAMLVVLGALYLMVRE